MRLTKLQTYILLLFTIIALCLIYQFVWFFGDTTSGKILGFRERKSFSKERSSISIVTIQYNVNGTYFVKDYLGSAVGKYSDTVSIRYLKFAPSISRVNTWQGNWGWIIVILPIAFIFLSQYFLIEDIVPANSEFLITTKFPFLTKLKKLNTTKH